MSSICNSTNRSPVSDLHTSVNMAWTTSVHKCQDSFPQFSKCLNTWKHSNKDLFQLVLKTTDESTLFPPARKTVFIV